MPHPATKEFRLNQTMRFYTEVLGMSLLQRLDFEETRFSLFFLAFLREDEEVPEDPAERARFVFSRETTLVLTHNWALKPMPALVATTLSGCGVSTWPLSGSPGWWRLTSLFTPSSSTRRCPRRPEHR